MEIDVSYQCDGSNDTAKSKNISTSGALIEPTPRKRSVGMKMILSVSLFPGASPIEISGEVVRETETGFALKFGSLDDRTQKLLRVGLPKAAKRR